MDGTTCPNCGREIPAEAGQHALTPTSGLVQCPHCGANVTLGEDVERADAAPPGRTEGEEEFAGEETIAGVMDELSEKEGGPR